jgi:PBP1b-binding outer membrane lipoprotein LpoB
MKTQNYILILMLCFSIIACSSETMEETNTETNTEMTGEPVNIGLSGQIEMCEREPESILCEDDE